MEKNTREKVKEWVGDGLMVEMAPLTKLGHSGKRMEVVLRPWAYIYNVVAHIKKKIEDLTDGNQIIKHPFIPDNKIHIKIGGDHGDNSFKMCYQLGNIAKPKSKRKYCSFQYI